MRYNEGMDIVTLTLNPCLDHTIWVEEFDAPAIGEEWQTGGKGINVARVLSNLGVSTLAVCPLGGNAGRRFSALAQTEGISLVSVPVACETRTILTWARKCDFAQRVDYSRGGVLSEEELDQLEATLFSVLPGAKALVVSGSASCEASAKRIPGILARAKALGIKTAIDSNGEALHLGAKAMPDLIKPNEAELASLTGSTEPDAAEALLNIGVGCVLLSMGAVGCCLIRDGRQSYCPAPKIDAINPVGSGDSFLAGYLYAALKGYADEFALMLACAAGAANARAFPAARIGRTEIEALLGISI